MQSTNTLITNFFQTKPESLRSSHNKSRGTKARPGELPHASFTTSILSKTVYLLIPVVLLWGWHFSSTEILTPKSGTGFWLGVTGACLMLLLVLYPLRKKKTWLRKAGSIKNWFRFHIAAGIVGPILVLFHANFKASSINCQVALTATILVTISGFFGRYVYTKIHYGLYGHRIKLEELKRKMEGNLEELLSVFSLYPESRDCLVQFGQEGLKRSPTLVRSLVHLLRMGKQHRQLLNALQHGYARKVREYALQCDWSGGEQQQLINFGQDLIVNQLSLTFRAAEFSFYERLFALWHIFHFPLFLLLILTGIVHVLAVTVY